jgi:hypothetical protein
MWKRSKYENVTPAHLLHRNGYILGDDFVPSNRHTPLLVFVNSRSGPQQGQLLVGQLRRLLNPIQVWILQMEVPEEFLNHFAL